MSNTVLADYEEELERQDRAISQPLPLHSRKRRVPAEGPGTVHNAVLEVVIRFPVVLHQADEIDERVTRELIRELDREPKLKLVDSEGPGLREATLSYS